MEELKFTLKCFVFTSLLIVLMQVKVGHSSVESYAFRWLQKSPTAQFIQSAAAGGAMALRKFGFALRNGIKSSLEGYEEGAHQKAIR